MATATPTFVFKTNRAHTTAIYWAVMRARVRASQPSRSRGLPLAVSKGLEGGGGRTKTKMYCTSLGGLTKKGQHPVPFFGGLRVALADLGDLTDPGQLNGQGPVLF